MNFCMNTSHYIKKYFTDLSNFSLSLKKVTVFVFTLVISYTSKIKYPKAFLAITIICIFTSCGANFEVLYSSNQLYRKAQDSLLIKRMHHYLWSDSLSLKTINNSKKVIPCDSIWGVMYKDGTIFRFYKEQHYLLRQSSSLIIYSQTHTGYKSSYTSYYFSKNLDSEIYSLKWKNIVKQFPNDTCFLGKLDRELKWYQDYSNYNKKDKSYRIVEFYNECKK